MVQIFGIRNGKGGIVTIKWAISIVGLLILSTSCTVHADLSQHEELRASQLNELTENLEKWKSHGIANYRMRFKWNCFCIDVRRSMLVDVRNGLVHSAVFEDDGTPASVAHVHSIDSLFVSIKKRLRDVVDWSEDQVGKRDFVFASYNVEYGYPGVAVFDSDFATDLYIDYEVELLTIMEEDANVSVHKTPEEIAQAIYGHMVPIPTGTFRMGDLSGAGYDNERPVRSVTVPAFKLGKYEVTYAQWYACVADGGCNGHRPRGWGYGGNRPVDGVSWDDTQSFIDWLNNKTGRNYRLPTEAEWEYAAGAGSATKYSWGDDVGRNRANCDGCGSQWDSSEAAPVGSFPANAWGLHDMHGNVSEWTEDCWNYDYEGAPTDGSAWTSGECDWRVIRGGSWENYAGDLRSAARYADKHSYRYNGFRLVHDG